MSVRLTLVRPQRFIIIRENVLKNTKGKGEIGSRQLMSMNDERGNPGSSFFFLLLQIFALKVNWRADGGCYC